ncbi:hypothetical protein B2J93_2494 [Marssonina coronariae]|uniref:Heme haloperoxidase family profile domain-containing protein n=1 Tax=Diplocarpon coronariae TaxID=2795749 RepID=A0A218ZGG7_9HELO|nr:hypothetical protein B2J93_2494 [Marssonina coronariae]
MRSSTAILGALALCTSQVAAFPAAAIEYAARAETDAFARGNIETAVERLRAARRAPAFDAAEQHVSTPGQHAFQAPNKPNDYNGDQLIMSQFQELYDLQPDASTANYDLSVLTRFRSKRFDQSTQNNPYFFNAPFAGVTVQPAAYTFIYRFMANKSAEHPEGVLNQEVLKSFFSITGDSGNFQWTEGYERIPENWYKRAIGDDYAIPFFLTDLLATALEYPKFLSIGGNTGKVNTFPGVDLADLTGGVFNAATLLQGNNLACFVLQAVVQFLPDALNSVEGAVGSILRTLENDLAGVLSPLACPKLDSINKDEFQGCPGAKGIFDA